MKIRLDKEGNYVLEIPSDVMDALGWKLNDKLTIDLPMTGGNVLVIHKSDKQ